MTTLSVGAFKANLSEMLKRVLAGEEIGISYGKNKEVVVRLAPKSTSKKERRKIGILEGKGTIKFEDDFSITEKEF